MQDLREIWYDPEAKASVVFVDVTGAASKLARAHLAGPTATQVLARALAAAALLGAETSESDETVILQMKCSGPIGGFNVECTAAGTLRGYTERKILDDFDGRGVPDDKTLFGTRRIQVTRSVPGRILSQGIATSLDGYFAGSLQRKACVFIEADVTDEAVVTFARGILVEDLPDAVGAPHSSRVANIKSIAGDIGPTLDALGLGKAVRRAAVPLSFACRCSPERAVAMLAALPPDERAALPPTVDITCHMCGRTFSVKT